ncbi:MAG: TetR/AcrR family transcriptional regulator C-terminal domain-containing protein [Actinobacteria bacterium]|nr:TetR/AcrR family transcriptional regulator C-terminal domain-containing protein [Actinomycetota bacterium]
MTPKTERTRPALTRQRVIDAAVALADREGIEALTIRALAVELDTKPMTLYHHVAGKEAIIDGVIDEVFAEIEMPPTDLPWQAAMRRRCISARDVLRRHPWATPLMESRANAGPANFAHHDAVLACLYRGGLERQLVAHAYALLDAFVYGFAVQESSLPIGDHEQTAEFADKMFAGFPPGAYPALVEFTRQHVLQPDYAFEDSFDFGLDLLLDGIERRRVAGMAAE